MLSLLIDTSGRKSGTSENYISTHTIESILSALAPRMGSPENEEGRRLTIHHSICCYAPPNPFDIDCFAVDRLLCKEIGLDLLEWSAEWVLMR